MNHIELLKSLDACNEAIRFAERHPDLKSAWNACKRPDWMLWLLDAVDHRDDKTYRLFTCWCIRNTELVDGRTVWDLLTDKRSRDAVEVAERYAEGQATEQELDAARAAARAAVSAAARAAASAAVSAAARAAARDAASAAAWAAARAAARAAVSAAAWDAQADRLREVIRWEDVEVSIQKFKECAA